MTLAIGWPHEVASTLGAWSHEPGDWYWSNGPCWMEVEDLRPSATTVP